VDLKFVFRLPATNLRVRRFLVQFGIGLLFVGFLVGHASGLYRQGLIAKLESALYDLKIDHYKLSGVDQRIVIVDVDEKSLKAMGRWPWPRSLTAELTGNLFEHYGVATVAYDLVFDQPDRSSGLPVLDRLARGSFAGDREYARILARLRPELDYDGQLAAALAKGPSVLGFYFNFGQDSEIVGRLPPAMVDCAELRRQGVSAPEGSGHIANMAALQDSALTAGSFNMQPDFDGVARRMPVVQAFQGRCYGSLSFLSVLAVMGIEQPVLSPAQGLRPAALTVGNLSMPLDRDGRALVPYRAEGTFEYVSAVDVIERRAPQEMLAGRIVLVGSTAPGIMDLRVTPVAKAFPGVEIHANLIAGILDGDVIWEPVDSDRIETLMLAALGLSVAALLPLIAPLWAALGTLLLCGAMLAGNLYLWHALHLSVPLAAPLLAVLGLFVLNMSYGFFIEARSKTHLTRLFGQYVPPELVDEMAKDPESYSLRGESRVMTVLFSDIRDFTGISESLEAARLAEMLDLYLSHMTGIIQHQRGTVDKYIGDAIMAFWGAPVRDEGHARGAVLTALRMQASLAELNRQLEAHGWPAVKIGIGINTGRMSVGNMGSRFRMAYTVMADAVNLASRLESLTKEYGAGVLVGEDTRAACPDIAFMAVDRVRVKGKARPVAIYEPLGLVAELDPVRLAEAAAFEAALESYRDRRWEAAEQTLRRLYEQNPRKLYALYRQRIAQFRTDPPPDDWDGVFNYTSK